MRHAMILCHAVGFTIAALLAACAAQVDEPASGTPKEETTQVAPEGPTSIASPMPTMLPAVSSCHTMACSSSAGGDGTAACRRACDDSAAWCINERCYVP